MASFTKPKIFIKHLQTAIRGDVKDFTTGSINKALFMLSVPMILEMVMESVFAVVDVFFVGRIGVNAVATVGLTESMLMLLYSVAIGFSTAATALVSRRIGEKNNQDAANSAMQAIYITFATAVLLAIPGVIFAKDILRMMGGSDTLIEDGYRYTQIMLGGNVWILLLFLLNGVFRGAGDAALAMRSLWLANIINIILCPILIFGWGPIPALGIMGAAIATNIGRGTGVVYQLFKLFGNNSIIQIHIQNLRLNWHIMVSLIKIALGGMGQFLIESASWIFLVRIISNFGSEALAGYTIGLRIIVFTILPSFGLANAAAALVGQNLGALKPERAEKSVWQAAFYNMIFLGIISIVFFISARPLIGIFSNQPGVIRYGKMCLQIVCLGYVFFAYGMVISQAFNGAGDTRTPTLINLFCHWLIQIPLAYLLSVVLKLEVLGTLLAVSFAFILHACISIVIFKKGNWKKTMV